MDIKWAEKLRKGLHGSADALGNLCVEAFHYLALFGIGAITAYAAVVTFLDMLGKGGVSVDDILLLFIYLELGRWSVSTSRPTTCRSASCCMWRSPR